MLPSPGPETPPLIAAMWLDMRHTWAGFLEFLEASLTQYENIHSYGISETDITDGLPATASYLEVRIYAALEIRQFQICTLATALGMTGCDCQTWTLLSMDNAFWYNCHHILLELHTVWS